VTLSVWLLAWLCFPQQHSDKLCNVRAQVFQQSSERVKQHAGLTAVYLQVAQVGIRAQELLPTLPRRLILSERECREVQVAGQVGGANRQRSRLILEQSLSCAQSTHNDCRLRHGNANHEPCTRLQAVESECGGKNLSPFVIGRSSSPIVGSIYSIAQRSVHCCTSAEFFIAIRISRHAATHSLAVALTSQASGIRPR
jgi:hypothetical protein